MMARGGAVVCFGEVLIRLNAPGRERLLQSMTFDAHIGGAEANVAVALARFGCEARMASVVADNALGEAAAGELRRHGVDIRSVSRAPGRMGLYFMSAGAVSRASEVLYDRAGSAFALAGGAAFDWPAVLAGAAWLHVSGVTPAVGPKAAAAAQQAVRAAKERGVKVCFDGNYRAQLWAAWKGDGPGVLRDILAHASLAFINERDIALILGETFEGEGEEARRKAFAAAFARFPALETIAATSRRQTSVDHHTLTTVMTTRDGVWRARDHELAGVVDRIGAGDAFAAGVLYGHLNGLDRQQTVDFAAAAAALKHSIPGDFLYASAADVERVMTGEGLDIRR